MNYSSALVTKGSFLYRNFFSLHVKVVQLCLTLCDAMDYTVHGILQVKILEWVAFPYSRGSFQPRNWTGVSCIAGRFFTNWAIREAPRPPWIHSFLPNFAPPLLHPWFLTYYLVYKNITIFCWTIKSKNGWILTFTDWTSHYKRSLTKDMSSLKLFSIIE